MKYLGIKGDVYYLFINDFRKILYKGRGSGKGSRRELFGCVWRGGEKGRKRRRRERE